MRLHQSIDAAYAKLNTIAARLCAVFGPYTERRERIVWAVASLVAAALFARHAIHASRVIDDVRYFWLDDDQMISMRYARNLAEGHGLVFNVGERVEGYSDFGWTLIMALVHLLGASDARAALYMQIIAFLLTAGTLWLTVQLLRALDVRNIAVLTTALLSLVVCPDIMYWATSGFSTSLTTFLEMLTVTRLLTLRRFDWPSAIAMALIPIARSDGLALWGGDVLLALAVCTNRVQALKVSALTLLPLIAHVTFRVTYYGDWFPNTYYLKVVGRMDRIRKGLGYLQEFWDRYFAVLILAVSVGLAWLSSRKVQGLLVLTALVPILCYSMATGGDNFRPFRFFGPLMPIIIAFSAAAASRHFVARRWALQLGLLVLTFLTVLPSRDPLNQIAKVGRNGGPARQLIPALMLRNNASPDASVLVIPAGIVPYFSRLKAVDLMGKTDRHVAHLAHRRGAGIAHGKFDPNYSLSLKPDYVVSLRSNSYARRAKRLAKKTKASKLRRDYRLSLLSSERFQKEYLRQPIVHRDLLSNNAVYVREGSPELERRNDWKGLNVGPWQDHSR